MSDFDASTVKVPDPCDWLPESIQEAWREVASKEWNDTPTEPVDKVLNWILYGDPDAEQAPEDSPEDRMRDLNIWRGKRKPQWWVNTYTCHDEYGGPEEGGWYFTVHVPYVGVIPESVGPFDDYVAACQISHQFGEARRAKDDDPENQRGYTTVERYPARVYPRHRPHYC